MEKQERQAGAPDSKSGEKYYVYVLMSEQTWFRYVGQSNDPEKRLCEHNSGKVRSTKPYRPLKIVYIEEAATRMEALRREKYYKTAFGRKKLAKLLKIAEMAELVDAPDSKSGEAQTS